MKKYCLYIAILIITCLLNTERCDAQNNPYKIRDELYGYYVATNNLISEKRGLLMADTLFRKAKVLGDVKAQCIALYLKTRYYHYMRDYVMERKLLQKYKPFILKSHYHQYYFGIWNSLFYEYIAEHNYRLLRTELARYRAEAFRLNNPYGIVSSYSRQGDMYFTTSNYKLAVPYYRKAIEYGIQFKSKDVAPIYSTLSRCYMYLMRWDDCEKSIQKSMENAVDFTDSVFAYSSYVKLYCFQTVVNKPKAEYYFHQFDSCYHQAHIKYTDQFLIDEGYYVYYKYCVGDMAKANLYDVPHLNEHTYIDHIKAAVYDDSIGDYKESCDNYKAYCDEIKAKSTATEKLLYDEFVPQLDFLSLEHQKKVLAQKKETMELNLLTKQRSIMLLNQKGMMARLITRQKEHDVFVSMLASRNEEINQKNRKIHNEKILSEQHRRGLLLMEEKENWQITAIIIFLTITSMITIQAVRYKVKSTKKLKAEKEKAQKAAMVKSLFFQNMNHEIRTPLNAIAGFNEILNGETGKSLSNEDKTDVINMMSMNSDLLLTLVNDVLDLSNFEGGTYKLNFADTDINKLCHTAIESIRGRENKGVELVFKPEDDQPFMLRTDAQRLQQILSNYLTNSCKHTETGNITLSYEIVDNMVRFTVTDTGCGISDEDAGKVFERFQMADKAKQGTGLGLHICSIIAGLLNGKVYLDRTYRQGCRFVFDHPIAKMLLWLFLSLSCTLTPLAAQNNKLGINNRIYQYYKQINNGNADEKTENMKLDVMLNMARRYHDRRAECLALSMKTELYNRMSKPDLLMYYYQRCRVLSMRTKNYKYLFNSWGEVISSMLQRQEFSSAQVELANSFNEALRLKSEDGISNYYYYAGNYYAMQKQFAAAINNYKQTLNYYNDDTYSIYAMLGQCFYFLEMYKDAIQYMNLALHASDNKLLQITPLIVLEKSYCLMNDADAATKVFNQLIELDSQPMGEAKKMNYHSALFYYYTYIKKDKDLADKEDLLSTDKSNHTSMASFYFARKDYVSAISYYRKAAKEWTEWLTADQMDTQNFYTSKFDLNEAIREKDQLTLANTRLKVNDMRNNQKLLAIQRENTAWNLRKADAKTRQKQLEIMLKNMKLKSQQEEINRQNKINDNIRQQLDIIRLSNNWKNFSLGIIVVFVLSTIIFYFVKIKIEEKRLIKETIDAEDADEKKTIFFENMNREIRDPINTIIMLNKQLNNDSVDSLYSEGDRQKMLAQLNRHTFHLTSLVNDVLEISKMESGTYPLKMELCDLNAICRDALAQIQISLQPGVVTVFLPNGEMDHDPTPCMICTDSNRLGTALLCLLKNACKYTTLGSLSLAYVLQDNLARISVTDTGEGIDHAIIDHIFYLDQQKQDGRMAGLGLHKVRVMLDILHGSISVDKDYHDGARFVIELPVKC